jgi:uncharacterized protein (DUF1800 family)
MLFALLMLTASLSAPPPRAVLAPGPIAAGIPWNARNAEHLLNRSGFGARSGDVDAAVAVGFDATLERLLNPPTDWVMPAYEPIDEPTKKELEGLPKDEQDRRKRAAREADRRQLLEATGWWFREMETSDAPLLEKMVLFWHGFFTTSIEETKRGFLVLQQHEFLRRDALGSYADLLRGIARDPAMLVYLDNNVNRKGSPNENFARELMEIFSLGEGNYSEADVKEAARALTGRGSSRTGAYEFRRRQHDEGDKTVLGVTGPLDGDQLVEILLKQDACPRWVARRLLTWFEGVEPEPARLTEYASFLRAREFEIRPFLEKMFSDPRFYRDEVVGARVLGPVEYMVGTARRMQVEVPPALLGAGAALLGQRVFSPPSVKGWDEGYAWISTSTLMQRGNLAGLMLGVVKVADVMSMADVEAEMATDPDGGMKSGDPMKPMDGDDPAMQPGRGPDDVPHAKPAARPIAKAKSSKAGGYALEILRRIEGSGWSSALNFRVRLERADARTDAQIVDRMLDDLLAIDAPADTRAKLRAFVASQRKELEIADGKLLDQRGDSERILRRLAHLILSLPEAQLG